MDIVYLSLYSLPGRSAHTNQIIYLCEAFAGQPDFRLKLITPQAPDKNLKGVSEDIWQQYGIKENFNIEFFPDPMNFRNRLPTLNISYVLLLMAIYIFKELLSRRQDFIFYSRSAFLSIPAKILSYIVSNKSYRGFFCELHDLVKKKFFIKYCNGIIATSNTLKNDILESNPPKKIFVAHNAVKSEFNIPFNQNFNRSLFGIPFDKVVITYSGKLTMEKGVDNLIRAVATLDREDVFLLLIGRPLNKDRNKYNEMIAKYGIKNFLFTGYIPPSEVRKYQAVSDILVVPSTKELKDHKYTCPIKLIEYLSAGKAIVASNLNVIRELIEDKKNGILYDVEKRGSLALAIKYLINHQELRLKLGREARATARKLSYENRAKNILEFIDSMLAL